MEIEEIQDALKEFYYYVEHDNFDEDIYYKVRDLFKDLQSQLKAKDEEIERYIEIVDKQHKIIALSNSMKQIKVKENTKLKEDIGTVLKELTISSLKKGEIELLKEENKELREKNFMPDFLTAENGAKALLSGEFYESIKTMDEDGNEIGIETVVKWTTIKEIYAKIHNHFLTN
jgi:hypothetical protein